MCEISAIRSGDYYMFDNIDDAEDFSFTDLKEEQTDSERQTKGQDLTFGEVCTHQIYFLLTNRGLDFLQRKKKIFFFYD